MSKTPLRQFLKLGSCATLCGLALALSSCGPPQAEPFEVRITLDRSLDKASVLVDLVGVSGSDQMVWQNYSMTKYWKEGDPMRRDAKKVVADFSAQTLTFTLAKNDPIWDQWLRAGAVNLAVLAYLPGRFEDVPGNADPRRRMVSLFPRVYKEGSKTVLTFEIKRSGINATTPLKLAGS
jgi:hypothetical protein